MGIEGPIKTPILDLKYIILLWNNHLFVKSTNKKKIVFIYLYTIIIYIVNDCIAFFFKPKKMKKNDKSFDIFNTSVIR